VREVLRDPAPAAVVAALEASEVAMFRHIARLVGASFVTRAGYARLVSSMPVPLLNRVMAARLPPDDPDGAIAAILAPYRRQGLPLHWSVWSIRRPEVVGAQLARHGLRPRGTFPGMAVDLERLPAAVKAPDDLEIRPVADRETRRLWLAVGEAGFGVGPAVAGALAAGFARRRRVGANPIVDLVGLRAGVPVGVASMLPAAGIAGIYSVATVPGARRQGIGSALTLAALRRGRDMGYRIGALWASRLGQGLYRRLGFEEVGTLHVYGWASPAP
jgi:GNAT superfamily N-acetyltransferase